jgi:hypothetical protein
MLSAAFDTLYAGVGWNLNIADRAIEPRLEELNIVLGAHNCIRRERKRLHVYNLLELTLFKNRQEGSGDIVHSKDIDV